MSIRVVVAEDQQMVRAGVVMLLNAEPDIEVVGEAPNGRAAVELAQTYTPDVVLMDLRMPEMDGIEATRQLAPQGHHVLVLTVMKDDQAVHEALCSGARGFVLKHTAPHELADAIRRVAGGQAWLDPDVTLGVIDRVATVAETSGDGSTFAEPLTPREREILVLIAEGRSNHEIAENFCLSLATVKTHLRNVMTKTGSRDRSQLVARAHRSGFMTSQARLRKNGRPDPGPTGSGAAR